MNPISRITMYDALTMLASGFLWCIMVFPPICCCHCHLGFEILFGIVCYIVGLLYHRLIDGLAFAGLDCLRDNEMMIRQSHRKVREKFPRKLKRESTLEAYYEAYYRLAEHKSLGSIPVLEAQAAFIRDIVPILGLYLIGVFSWEFGIYKNLDRFLFTRYEVGVFLGGAILLLVVARFVSQYKIYELVWEGSCFIQDKEEEKGK